VTADTTQWPGSEGAATMLVGNGRAVTILKGDWAVETVHGWSVSRRKPNETVSEVCACHCFGSVRT
jgi:hypothetical protein